MKYINTLTIIAVVLIMISKISINKSEAFENYPNKFHLKREPSCYYVDKSSMKNVQSTGM